MVKLNKSTVVRRLLPHFQGAVNLRSISKGGKYHLKDMPKLINDLATENLAPYDLTVWRNSQSYKSDIRILSFFLKLCATNSVPCTVKHNRDNTQHANAGTRQNTHFQATVS